jgi:transposase-like protein
MKTLNNPIIRDLLQKALTAKSHEEMVSYLLNLLALVERNIYLQNTPDDKGNGFRHRKLHAGSQTYNLSIPRTRMGVFRPSFLPEKWKRCVPSDFTNLAYSLILSSKSIEAAKRAIRDLDLPVSEGCFERVLQELQKEFKALNNSPLPPDWFSLSLDAKHTSIMVDGVITPYTVYIIVGTSLDGERKVLVSMIKEGNENLQGWKDVLKNLLSRGIRRVLVVTHDDYPGLSGVVESYFPKTDVQLCIVHFVRNLKKHLTPESFRKAKEFLDSIKSAVSYEHGLTLFEEMLEIMRKGNPSYVQEVERKKVYYLSFLKYPKELRKSLYSTNLVESVNRKIEDAEQMSGGYFHSIRNLEVRLSLIFKELHSGKWNRKIPVVVKVKHFLYVLFEERFGDG